MILAVLLVLINIVILSYTREPEELLVVKEKYKILREHLSTLDAPEFDSIKRRILLSGYYRPVDGTVGYNTNKGAEIGICLSGTPNEIFHVLLHELAHCTVSEYDHSEQFWKNYEKLRNIAVQLGVYEQISTKTGFCGKHIQDK
jgi:hypothetical protein